MRRIVRRNRWRAILAFVSLGVVIAGCDQTDKLVSEPVDQAPSRSTASRPEERPRCRLPNAKMKKGMRRNPSTTRSRLRKLRVILEKGTEAPLHR